MCLEVWGLGLGDLGFRGLGVYDLIFWNLSAYGVAFRLGFKVQFFLEFRV